jgi:hypothetical protein
MQIYYANFLKQWALVKFTNLHTFVEELQKNLNVLLLFKSYFLKLNFNASSIKQFVTNYFERENKLVVFYFFEDLGPVL